MTYPTRWIRVAFPVTLLVASSIPIRGAAQTLLPRERFVSAGFGLALGSSAGIYTNTFASGPTPSRIFLQAGISPRGRLVIDGEGRIGPRAAALTGILRLHVSGLDQTRFHGAGHYTAGDRPSAYYDVEQYRYSLTGQARWSHGEWSLAVGPVVEMVSTDTDIDAGLQHIIGDPLPLAARRQGVVVEDLGFMQLTRPYGSGRFTQAGVAATVAANLGRTTSYRAFVLRATAAVHPAWLSLDAPYARVSTSLSARQRLTVPLELTLAWRGGATKVWGHTPFFDLADLGGRSSLRGFAKDRFAGQASVFSQVELHARIGHATLVRPVDYGVFGLVDLGRVQEAGLTLTEWHVTQGIGVWLRPRNGQTFTAAVARGAEGPRLYLGIGWP